MGEAARARRTRVIYVQYANPAAYPPIEHSATLLAERGAEVLLLGTIRDGDTRRMTPPPGVIVDLMRVREAGWRQKTDYARFTLRAARRAHAWRPTWIYASDALSSVPTLAMARSSGAAVVYHEHDAPHGNSSPSPFMSGVLIARRAVATRAAFCVLPSAERVALFREQTGRQDITVVMNCPLRAEAGPAPAGRAGHGLRVLYHGSIVPARLPTTVLDALADLPAAVTLVVAGYETAGHPGYVRELAARADRLGITSRVEFTGTLPTRADVLAHCGRCDVGLALMPSSSADFNERTMAGASNKAFDYLARGLPLLVTDRPEWRALFADAGLARVCDPDSSQSIAAAFAWFLSNPDQRRAMGARGRERILDGWNYERQFAPVADRLMPYGRAANARAAS
jgi:glycosyltransferase involved in cell wall biosynthesis